MLSTAYKIKGQGVGSAYEEQVGLVKENMADDFEIFENKVMFADITHYHTINFLYYVFMGLVKRRGITVGYVHFLPETVETSIQLPHFIKNVFYWYTISFYKIFFDTYFYAEQL